MSPNEETAALQAIDAAAVREWLRGHIRADRATLYVAADTTMATLRPQLEKALAVWAAQGAPVPVPVIPPAHGSATPSLTVFDTPGAAQTFVMAGRAISHVGRPDSADATAIWAANEIYGGNSTARISSNLRTDKGWTYGIGSALYDTPAGLRWILAGTVNREHSGDAIAELIKEMRGLTGEHGPGASELTRLATTAANQSAAKLEGDRDLLTAMADAQSNGLPIDDSVRQPARLQALTPDEVRRAADALFDPNKVHWVLVGDWQAIRNQFANLELGPPVVVKPDR